MKAAMMDSCELMHQFQSLGEDCEFSFIQRSAGAEPLEMLRFTGTTIAELVAAFESRFVAIGDPSFTVLRADSEEVWGINTRHNFESHNFKMVDPAEIPSFQRKFVEKMQFLRRKFLEDLADGEKFLVYKRRVPITYYKVHGLYTSIRKFSASPLLWVVKTDKQHPPGTVENLGGGFFKGYIGRFSPYGHAASGSLDAWVDICRNAHDLRQSAPASRQLEPPVPTRPRFLTGPVWVAKATTSLKSAPVPAASLAPRQKVEIDIGDIVVVKAYEQEAGHLKLYDVVLNGEPLSEPWFAYLGHWEKATDIDSSLVGESHASLKT